MADEQRIRVIRPDGKTSTIPLSTLPLAIKKKYRPADGSFLPSAPEVKSGLSLENQRPFAGVGRGLANTVLGLFQLLTATKNEDLKRMFVDPLNQLADEARSDIKAGRGEGYGKAIASGIPILGPMMADLGKRAGSGDIAGATTEGLTYALLPKVTEKGAAGLRSRFPEGSLSQAATRPLVQKYLFDRSTSVRNMISQAANTFDKMIGERFQNIEKTVDAAHPNGAIDASNLRVNTVAAKNDLIAADQKLPSAIKQIESKGEAPRVFGSRLDLTNPVHKGLYDRLVEEGALPSADRISWQEARQIRSKLGRELRGQSQLSGEAKAFGWRVYDDLTNKLRAAADTVNLGPSFDLANKMHSQYMQDFVDIKSPLAKAIKGQNPHGIMEPLSSPRYAEQARRMASKYEGLGIKPDLMFKEGNLFQKYKSGLPKQWEPNRWEVTADVMTGVGSGMISGSPEALALGFTPTAVRATHNFLSRARALRNLQP